MRAGLVSRLAAQAGRLRLGAVPAERRGGAYSTIRLSPARTRTLTAAEAGFAATCISSAVRDEIIVRAFLGVLLTRLILRMLFGVRVSRRSAK